MTKSSRFLRRLSSRFWRRNGLKMSMWLIRLPRIYLLHHQTRSDDLATPLIRSHHASANTFPPVSLALRLLTNSLHQRSWHTHGVESGQPPTQTCPVWLRIIHVCVRVHPISCLLALASVNICCCSHAVRYNIFSVLIFFMFPNCTLRVSVQLNQYLCACIQMTSKMN